MAAKGWQFNYDNCCSIELNPKTHAMKNLLFVLLLVSLATVAQKAYQVVKYTATVTGGGVVTFNYGDGYFGASEAYLYNGKDRSTSKFLYSPEKSSKRFQVFVSYDGRNYNSKKFIGLYMNKDNAPGNKIKGTFYYSGSSVNFTLRK
jgi:hypothetical protein